MSIELFLLTINQSRTVATRFPWRFSIEAAFRQTEHWGATRMAVNIDSTFIDSLNTISWYCYNRLIRDALRYCSPRYHIPLVIYSVRMMKGIELNS